MLITKTVEIKWNGNNKKWYESKGYIFPKWKDEFEVKVEDLSNCSAIKICVKCDNCGEILNVNWGDYKKCIKDNEKYYCKKCAIELFARKKMEITKLNNSISFAQWLINKDNNNIINYWSDKNTIDPFKISYASNKKVWIKCQEKDYHEDYEVSCSDFINGRRCPFCRGLKVHKLDSLGYLYPKVLEIWSDKNKKSPYEYTPNSGLKVYWKCLDGDHEDYLRSIYDSNRYEFRCPKCGFSKGEKQVLDYLQNNSIYNIPQMSFDGLIGLGGGSLLYDFYLPTYNLLIEYDGEYHYMPIKNSKNESKKHIAERFKKQKIHDKLKDEYAINNNIKLLRIPYWSYDNIKNILDEEFLHITEI